MWIYILLYFFIIQNMLLNFLLMFYPLNIWIVFVWLLIKIELSHILRFKSFYIKKEKPEQASNI